MLLFDDGYICFPLLFKDIDSAAIVPTFGKMITCYKVFLFWSNKVSSFTKETKRTNLITFSAPDKRERNVKGPFRANYNDSSK